MADAPVKKVPGRPFPKGMSGNPGGRPALTREAKEFRRELQDRFEKTVKKFCDMSARDIAAHLKRPETPGWELWIGQLFIKGINHGDYLRIGAVMDRIIGRPKERVELSGPEGAPVEYRNVSDEELRAEIARLQAEAAMLEREKRGSGDDDK